MSIWQPRKDRRYSASGHGADEPCQMQLLHTDEASQEHQGHLQTHHLCCLYLHITTTQALQPSAFPQDWSGFTQTERPQCLHRCVSLGTKLLRAPATTFRCSSPGNLPCSRQTGMAWSRGAHGGEEWHETPCNLWTHS